MKNVISRSSYSKENESFPQSLEKLYEILCFSTNIISLSRETIGFPNDFIILLEKKKYIIFNASRNFSTFQIFEIVQP